jgi:homoserine O-acetyltransferase/O-succinyltransferase
MHHQTFELGDISLISGGILQDAKLAFQTYGALNAARDNRILLPTYFTGTHLSCEPMIGPGKVLDHRLSSAPLRREMDQHWVASRDSS